MVMFPNQGPVFIKGEIKKKKKKYVLSGSFNLTNTPEESPMYGTFCDRGKLVRVFNSHRQDHS